MKEQLHAVGHARHWPSALAANGEAFHAFAAQFESSGSTSRATDFVKAGTVLHVVKVESMIGD